MKPGFLIGLLLAVGSVYFFFDSVRITTGNYGFFHRYFWGDGPTGIVFVPFFVGMFSLFLNHKQKLGWVLTFGGLALIAAEIISRIHFFMYMKTTHLLLIMGMFAAGTAMMFKSYKSSDKD